MIGYRQSIANKVQHKLHTNPTSGHDIRCCRYWCHYPEVEKYNIMLEVTHSMRM